MGGDRVNYQVEVSTKTAGLTDHKAPPKYFDIISRSKIHDSRCEIFYLNNQMDEPEYTKILVRLIPDEIKVEYKVSKFEHARYVYVKLNKGHIWIGTNRSSIK